MTGYIGNPVDIDSLPVTPDTLEAVSRFLTATTVDVFVYDTSKDSDGGAWRQRCSHLSWYNETLNTATRGATREFPAVAIIVAEANTVTIYDATDSAVPMWMMFTASSGDNMLGVNDKTAISMVNAVLVVGTWFGVGKIGFISDRAVRYRESAGIGHTGNCLGNISERNDAKSWDLSGSEAIAGDAVNDIALTVLPNAPIDSATGLPIPVVYVGTDGGLSRIAEDGSVSDWTDDGNTVNIVELVAVLDGYVLWNTDNISTKRFTLAQTVSTALVESRYNSSDLHYLATDAVVWTTTVTPILYNGIASEFLDVAHNAIATDRSLTLIKPNPSSWGHGLHATITSDFNSGWQYGDIRGAWLADSTAETLVGTELVTNGDFATDTDWTKGTGWTIGSSVASSDGTQTADSLLTTSTVPTTVAGTTYVISFEVTAYTAGNVALSFDGVEVITDKSATGVYMATAIASDTTGTIDITADLNFVGSVDNVTVSLADPDRSYNNNGLVVNGSVTKAAVSSGADLMSYSGFSASNYLSQPYNSDLDFGTGDFYVMGWVSAVDTVSLNRIACRAYYSGGWSGGGHILLAMDGNGTVYFQITDDDFASQDNLTSNALVENSGWNFIVAYRSGSSIYLNINGVSDSSTALVNAVATLNNSLATLYIGNRQDDNSPAADLSTSLLRIGAGAPTAEQIKEIYESEKHLFVDNADCTLSGTSSDVVAVDYDEVTGKVYACSTTDMSVFKGLVRVDEENTAYTSISAHNDIVAKGN